MAKEVITRLTDDISGGEATETVAFSYRGHSYEIDLGEKNAAAFDRDMGKYIGKARRAGRISVSRPPRKAAGRDYDLPALREWAASKKLDLPARGRISQAVIDEYKASGGR